MTSDKRPKKSKSCLDIIFVKLIDFNYVSLTTMASDLSFSAIMMKYTNIFLLISICYIPGHHAWSIFCIFEENRCSIGKSSTISDQRRTCESFEAINHYSNVQNIKNYYRETQGHAKNNAGIQTSADADNYIA